MISQILKLKDGNGDTVEAIKRPFEIGDRCVILLPRMVDTVLYFIPTGKPAIMTISALHHNHIKFKNGGSWREDLVYQILE